MPDIPGEGGNIGLFCPGSLPLFIYNVFLATFPNVAFLMFMMLGRTAFINNVQKTI